MQRQTTPAGRRSGFTLIEILIVVIILGILAAIVIPQFSSASSDARKSSVQSTAQTLRSQIALYKLQHNDTLPNIVGGTATDTSNWNQLLFKSDVTGSTTATTGPFYGPYMQAVPKNALSNSTVVVDGTGTAGSACGYLYDYSSGSGSGKLWGTDTDGLTIIP